MTIRDMVLHDHVIEPVPVPFPRPIENARLPRAPGDAIDRHVDGRVVMRHEALERRSSLEAVSVVAVRQLGSALNAIGSGASSLAGSAIRIAAPIVGEVFGATGLLVSMQSPAGESDADLGKTRAIDLASHRRLAASIHRGEGDLHPPITITPAHHPDVGPGHTTLPIRRSLSQNDVLSTPIHDSKIVLLDRPVLRDIGAITRPTGVAEYSREMADRMTIANRSDVTPEHVAHMTSTGKLVNADKAVIPPQKLTEYALNPEHPRGRDKARVFQSALGFDRSNSSDLEAQIRVGVKEQPAIPGQILDVGTTFAVDIPVVGPVGAAVVRTGWIYERNDNAPRLTSLWVK